MWGSLKIIIVVPVRKMRSKSQLHDTHIASFAQQGQLQAAPTDHSNNCWRLGLRGF